MRGFESPMLPLGLDSCGRRRSLDSSGRWKPLIGHYTRVGSLQMTRASFIVAAAIVLGAIAAVAPQCVCTSAQAQAQTASPEPTIWDHNGSVMYMVANGSLREFYYQKPRPGMLDAGAHPGSLLFRGHANDGKYLGTAYGFNPHCGPIPFEVKGPILDDDERIVLTGQAPRVGRKCRSYASYTSNLEFRRLEPNEAAQSQEPPLIEVSKPDVLSRNGDELPSGATARPSVKNENPVAGKDSSLGVADRKVPSTLAAQATNEMPGAKDLDKYKWEAAFVMIVWLLIVLFGKILLRKNG
jgi:hypothetical protein